MVELNWKEINSELQGITFSVIGCNFPENLDKNVEEVLDIVFNQIYLAPHEEEFIKTYYSIGKQPVLTEVQINILKNILKTNTRDEIISRIGDALWFLKKDINGAQKAIQAHKNLFERDKILDEARRSQALINACTTFNLMSQLRQSEEAINFMTNLIDSALEEKNEFFCDNFLDFVIQKNKFKMLSDDKKDDYKNYLKEKARDYGAANFFGKLLVQIARKENDIEAQKEAHTLIAEGWEGIGKASENDIRRADAMSKAADNYKKAGDKESANRCTLEANKTLKNQSEWTSRSYPIDLKPVLDACDLEFNKATTVIERIRLVTYFTKIKYKDTLIQHNKNKEENSFYGRFRKQSIDENGIVRSSLEGIDPASRQSEEPYLIKIVTQQIGINSHMIYNLNQKYVLSEIDQVTFSEIIKPLLPGNVQMMDYILRMVLSFHPEIVIEPLLVAFESFLASLLEINDIPSVKQMADGNTQEDLTMGTLINECKKNELINKDDILVIEALLSNKHGMNLRNISSHRLTPDTQRVSPVYLFCAYFLIRLFAEYGSSSKIDE